MGLPARQRRVLERIEGTLRGSDPKLAALYAIFARLNRDEEMPRIEQVMHGVRALLVTVRHVLAILLTPITWLFVRIAPRQRAVLLFPLALAVAITGIVFAARAGSGNNCVPVRSVSATTGPAKATGLCRTGFQYMGNYGK